MDISITHPAIFHSAVHSVVGVGTFRRTVDPEKCRKAKTRLQKRPTAERKVEYISFTDVILSVAELKLGLVSHVTASVEPQRVVSDHQSEKVSVYE